MNHARYDSYKAKLLIGACLALMGVALIPAATHAATLTANYAAGHQALELWNAEARSNAPAAVKLWLNIMAATFLSGLLFVWKHASARWVVGGVLLSVGGGGFIAQALDLVMLSGYVALLHLIFWSPGLFFLLRERAICKGLSLYSSWATTAALVIMISFVFDIRDASIYIMHMLG